MTTAPNDDALRARFAGLRERDRETAPGFVAFLASAPASGRPPRPTAGPALAGAVACAVALLVATAWLRAPPPATPSEPVSLVMPGWRTPTDTLLTHGADVSPQPTPWTGLPTDVLGRSPSHRSQETP